MSSSGRMRAMTPLLPWRPAILSPTDSLRFMATKTLTSLITPGGSSSPRFSRLSFSAKSAFSTSICRSVLSTISLSSSSTSSSSAPFTRSFRMSEWRRRDSTSRVSLSPFLMTFSPRALTRSVVAVLPSSRSSMRLSRSS